MGANFRSASWRVVLALLGCTAIGVGCGGQVERSGDEDENPETAKNSGSSETRDTRDNSDFGTIDLGPCTKGKEDTGQKDCGWLGEDGLCYPTKEAACACLCPSGSQSACVSPLFGEGDRIPVNCG